ncbi:MAG TPA: DUF4340 domain-containing protein [Vicinamibacterales bacterium]
MRGLKSTLALLVVLIGLGGYIYFVLAKKSDSTVTKQEKVFPALESSKIDDITVKSESGDVTSLKKDGGAWKIVSPIQVTAADQDATSLANALGDVEIVRVVEDNPTDLKPYGLDQPQIDVQYKSSQAKADGHLLVGAKAAAGGNLYAKRADQKQVVLIAQYHESALNKSTFDLRDKTIMKVDHDKVDGIDVNTGGKTFELAKAGTDWKMTKPVAARADFSAADGLVTRVQSAQMKKVVTTSPSPADLKTYGFDKPQAVVNLHLGSARATFEVGGKADDTTTYVRDTSKPDIYTIENSSADDFKKPADDYRKKELFDFRAFDATRVELTKNGQTVIFERVKAKDDKSPDTWHRVSPNPGDPDRSKVESLLAGLADIRATSFVDATAKTGFQMPALVVDAKFDDGKKQEKVTFGKNGSDAYASRPDDPGAAKIESEKLDDAIKALDELSK